MNIKLFLKLAMVFLLMSSAQAQEIAETNEDVIEGAPDSIFISSNLEGSMRIKACNSCETLKLRITPTTRAFLEGESVLLKSMVSRKDKPLVIFYDAEKKLVTRLHWFNR